MKKTTTSALVLQPTILVQIFIVSVAALFIFAPLSYGESPGQKTSKVETKLSSETEVEKHTLSPSLMTAWRGGGVPTLSLLSSPFTVGTRGAVQYQKFGKNSYRIQFDAKQGTTSLFLLFQYEMDLRDRWVRISYSGINGPEKISVVVDRLENRTGSTFPIYLEKSKTVHDSYFKLPDRVPFSKVTSLDFVIDPKEQKAGRGEFLFLDMQVMSKQFNPLRTERVQPVKISPYPELFQADNMVAISLK